MQRAEGEVFPAGRREAGFSEVGDAAKGDGVMGQGGEETTWLTEQQESG